MNIILYPLYVVLNLIGTVLTFPLAFVIVLMVGLFYLSNHVSSNMLVSKEVSDKVSNVMNRHQEES